MRCSCPIPLAENPPKYNVSISMFYSGNGGVLGVIGSIPPPPNMRVELIPKSWTLVSFDHNTFTQFSSESLANFRQACICAFLSRGTLKVLQDFSPSRCSVTNCFLGDYGPSCLEIIGMIRPCSSGLIPHRSHDHLNSTK